jgi:hypothetical protein
MSDGGAPNVIDTLKDLPAVACSNPNGPKCCYCARGTTKPVAEVDAEGQVEHVYCNPVHLKEIYVRFFK